MYFTCIRGLTSTTHQGFPSSQPLFCLTSNPPNLTQQTVFLPQLCTFSLSLSPVPLVCARVIIIKKCARTPTNVCPAGEPKPNWAVLLPGLPIGWEGPPGLPLGGNCPELVQYGGHSYTSRYLCVYRSPPPPYRPAPVRYLFPTAFYSAFPALFSLFFRKFKLKFL